MIAQGFTDLSSGRLYALKKKAATGVPINDVMGRPPLMSVPQMDALVTSTTLSGNTLGNEMIGPELQAAAEGIRTDAGLSGVGASFSFKTLKNAKALALTATGARPTMAACYKSDKRITSEDSLMNMATQLAVVATNHYIPVAEGRGSDSELGRMVSKCSGGVPVVPVSPFMVFSVDDSTLFAYVGKQGEAEVRVASASESGKKRAAFKPLDSPFVSGLRVRPTLVISAAGLVGPLVVCVTGLSPRENNHPSGMCVMEVPGFCICGASDHRANEVGYIVFLCSENESGESLEQRYFDWFRNKIMIPMIEDVRVKYLGHVSGQEVSDENAACCWNEGGLPQLHAITSEAQQALEAALKIRSLKHPAAMTGVAQPCDVGPQFRLLKQLEKFAGPFDGVPGSLPLKLMLEACFKKHSDVLNLRTVAQKTVIDFCVRFPTMMAKACTPQNVVTSFVDTGFLDAERREPSLQKIMAMCRHPLSVAEVTLVKDSFAECFEIMDKRGIITDDELVAMGYPVDLNSNGEPEWRDAGVGAEHRQRGKVLRHTSERARRQQLVADKAAAEVAKVASECTKRSALLATNRQAEADLLVLLGKLPTSSRNQLASASPEMFGKLSGDKLKAFIHARKFLSSAAHGKWPNKGKVGAAEESLISMVHFLRSAALTLKAAAVTSGGAAAAAASVPPLVVTATSGLAATIATGALPSVLLQPAVAGCGVSESAWVLRGADGTSPDRRRPRARRPPPPAALQPAAEPH